MRPNPYDYEDVTNARDPDMDISRHISKRKKQINSTEIITRKFTWFLRLFRRKWRTQKV